MLSARAVRALAEPSLVIRRPCRLHSQAFELSTKILAKIFDQEHKLVPIDGALLEVKMSIELSCFIVNCVNEHSSCRYDINGFCDPAQGIL